MTVPTRRPAATRTEAGDWMLKVSPRLELTRDQVAAALAVVYGLPRPSHGPTTIPTVVGQWVDLVLQGKATLAPPESTVQAWRDQLLEWKVWPR